MRIADNWVDYELINMDNGMKKERWGDYVLVRPDPQIIWNNNVDFGKYDALYRRSNKGGGSWEYKTKLKDNWQIKYKDLTFNIKPMGFKHTGLFPEQAVNWDYMIDKIKNSGREIKVLNLFAYTGGATVACLYAGASVCHVDSSRGMVEGAKANVNSSILSSANFIASSKFSASTLIIPYIAYSTTTLKDFFIKISPKLYILFII